MPSIKIPMPFTVFEKTLNVSQSMQQLTYTTLIYWSRCHPVLSSSSIHLGFLEKRAVVSPKPCSLMVDCLRGSSIKLIMSSAQMGALSLIFSTILTLLRPDIPHPIETELEKGRFVLVQKLQRKVKPKKGQRTKEKVQIWELKHL